MNKQGEIIIVDDDVDDGELFTDSLGRLNIANKVLWFNNVQEALDHLRKVDSDPFLIFSDMRMPKINGFEFKQMIFADSNLVTKAVPFVLFSGVIDKTSLSTGLTVGVQGFFLKPASTQALDEMLSMVINYFQKGFGDSAS